MQQEILGINNAQGTYIGFIDSDDYISALYVDTLLKNAYKYDVDMVKAGYFEFNSDNYNIIKEISFQEDMMEINKNNYKLQNIKGHAWGSIIKRDIFDQIRFPVGYWYEDMIMKFLVMPQCKKIKILEEKLYYYRITPTGLSRNVQKVKSYKCLEQYFLLEKILEKYKDLGLQNNEFTYRAILHELGTVLWLRTRRLDNETIKDIFTLACDLFNRYNLENKNLKLNFNQKYIRKSLQKKDFYLWRLISIYSMFEIKYL